MVIILVFDAVKLAKGLVTGEDGGLIDFVALYDRHKLNFEVVAERLGRLMRYI